MSDKRQAIGVDLGGTNLRAALVEIDGDEARVVIQRRHRVGDDRDPRAVARTLAETVGELDDAVTPDTPVGIGLAAMLRGSRGFVVNAPNLGWNEEPFGDLVRAALKRPLWIENDLSAIAWGEYRFGVGKPFDDLLCVFIGTGVGGGAVLGGRLFRGASNAAVEIGHVKLVEGGRLCGCGQRGCLEAYAGGRQLADQARERPSPALLALAGGDVSVLHAGHLDEAARGGDESSRRIVCRAAGFLGQALAGAVTLFNPDCLLLGGTVWDNAPLLREETLASFGALTNAPAHEVVTVVEATRSDDIGVLGAAELGLLEASV